MVLANFLKKLRGKMMLIIPGLLILMMIISSILFLKNRIKVKTLLQLFLEHLSPINVTNLWNMLVKAVPSTITKSTSPKIIM